MAVTCPGEMKSLPQENSKGWSLAWVRCPYPVAPVPGFLQNYQTRPWEGAGWDEAGSLEVWTQELP